MSESSEPDDGTGAAYAPKTLRSAFIVALCLTLVLLSYGQTWAVGPFWLGLGVASLLFWGWDQFIRRVFTPEAARLAKSEKKGDRRWALMAFALVKYPLVGLLLWYLVQLWQNDPPGQQRLMVFVGGFLLLQAVIALRAVGRLLTDKN